MDADSVNARARDGQDRHWRLRSLLARLPLFAGLSTGQLNRLAGIGRSLDFAAHDTLFRAGEPIRDAYVLVAGSAKRSTRLPSDTEKVIELAQAPQLMGLGEFFAAERYASSCVAITPGTAVAIAAEPLRALVRQDRELAGRVIRSLAERQYASEIDSTGYHSGSTGTQRVLDYLLGLAGAPLDLAGETTVTLNASKKMIAARIDMTPESFSRSLRQLSDTGLIVVEGRHVHIQNAALLDTESGDQGQRLSFPRKAKTAGGTDGPLSPGMLINLCGQPRMLSQRMASNWGLIGQNITPAKAALRLQRLGAQLERTLVQLGGLGLPPPFAEALAAVEKTWADYRQCLFACRPSLAGAGSVLDCSEEILTAIDRLIGAAESHSGLAAVREVNIAGRNRMLTQRIGKLVVFREWGLAGDAVAQRLGESLCEFDVNLVRLKRSAAGVPELAAQLNEVAAQWQAFETLTLSDPDATAGSRHALRVLAAGERLFRHADTVVKLYERLAR